MSLPNRRVVIVFYLAALLVFCPYRCGGAEEKQEEKKTVPDRAEMKKEIVEKNIFRPGRIPPAYSRDLTRDLPLSEIGPAPLNRPFRFVAFDQTDQGSQAYLQFDNPPEIRSIKAGEMIEFMVEITEIKPTYIRCRYDDRKIRIDMGETSDDAIKRLRGFGPIADYDLIGTTILDNVAFAHFRIEGQLRRLEKNDKLGQAAIVDILPGKVRVRLESGEEIEIVPTTPAAKTFPLP